MRNKEPEGHQAAARDDSEGPDGDPPETIFEVDKRPMLVVLASRLWKQLALIVLLILFCYVANLTPPQGLTVAGWKVVCIFLLCATLWASSLLPLAITSLGAMALIPLMGVMSASEAYSYFGSPVVFFIMGALMLSAAMIRSGLSKRLATVVVRRFGETPARLVMAVFLLCAAGATVMSEHAVAVMMLPIITDICRALGLRPLKSNMGRALFFAMAWGCIIGGSLTVLGGARAPLAIGILEERTAHVTTIGFMDFISYSAPLVVLMLMAGVVMLKVLFKPEITSTRRAVEDLEAQLRGMGKVSVREQVVGLIMVATVVAWATIGDAVGLDTIAIIAMAALFALRTVTWREIEDEVNWGIILMYGGAISLSAALAQTGAATWLTATLFPATIESPTLILILLAVTSAVLTEFMSNSAVVAMLLPPALALAQSHGIDLRAATMAVVLASNFAFMFPISTPVTAMAWSAGYYTPREVVRTGVMLHAIGFAAMIGLITLWWEAIGLV